MDSQQSFSTPVAADATTVVYSPWFYCPGVDQINFLMRSTSPATQILKAKRSIEFSVDAIQPKTCSAAVQAFSEDDLGCDHAVEAVYQLVVSGRVLRNPFPYAREAYTLGGDDSPGDISWAPNAYGVAEVDPPSPPILAPPTADVNITAPLGLDSAPAHGSVSPVDNVTLARGQKLTILMTPDEGYKVNGIAVDGGDIGDDIAVVFGEGVQGYQIEGDGTPHGYQVFFISAG